MDNITQIKQIVEQNPRHYSAMIRRNIVLIEELNNRYPGLPINEQIYCLINDTFPPKICENGNRPLFNTVFKGYREFCGPKSKCSCARKAHSKSIGKTLKNSEKYKKGRLQAKSTMIDKFGADNAMKVDSLKQKCIDNRDKEKHLANTKSACRKRYGVDFPLQSRKVQEKSRKTTLDRHGNLMTHAREALYEKYNGNPFENVEVKQKIKETMQKRYGVNHIKHVGINAEYLDLFEDDVAFEQFIRDKTVKQIAIELDVSTSTIQRQLTRRDLWKYVDVTTSSLERDMQLFLESLNIEFMQNYKKIKNVTEVDFFLPKQNLAIEMNGDYWHCSIVREDKNYHRNKWKECEEAGVRLLQISESEYWNNREKYHALVKSLLHMNTKTIGARKLTINTIDYRTASAFLDLYHLQGSVRGSSYFGAWHDNKLHAVMVFGKTRNQNFELKRFVTTPGISFPGIFSKMFKHAQLELNFESVKSFSDNNWFSGNMYKKSGFELSRVLPPGYRYFYQGKLWHMQNFTKNKIKEKFELDIDIAEYTENQLMTMLGIPRVYDSGKREWTWSKRT